MKKQFTTYLFIGYAVLLFFLLPRLMGKQQPPVPAAAPTAADWPYKVARTLPVVTTKNVLNNGKPILVVFHDAKNDNWQFLDAEAPSVSDLTTATLEEIVSSDGTVHDLIADLKPGWAAFRKDKAATWTSAPQSGGQ